jgi:hemerythrin
MTAIPWRDEFKTGIMSVDHDHNSLIEAINDLCDRLESDIPEDRVFRRLGDIHALIETHFAEEEKSMLDTAFSGFPEHKLDHDLLLNDILQIMNRVKAEKFTDHISVLGKTATDWFSIHFPTLDKAFHLQTHGADNYDT